MKKLENTNVELHWDKQAKTWAQEIREGKDVFRDLFNNPRFLEFIGNIKSKIILDAGCGEGYNTRIFAKNGGILTGIDLSENMIALAKEEEMKNPLGIKYFISSFTNMYEFKNSTFDIVLSTMALMDSPNYEDAIKEFFRVLKPGGGLFFSILHPCFMTPNYKWIEQDGVRKKIIGNYFRQGPWEFSWDLSKKFDKSDAVKFTSSSFHRTISTYINVLLNSGFLLKKIGEPVPTEEACIQNPRLNCAKEVASFLYVHAIKP